MEQGAAQLDADKVVVVLAGPTHGLEAAERAAQEAARHGSGLVLMAVDGGSVSPASAVRHAPEWLQHVADLARRWPEFRVEVVAAAGAATAHPAVLGSTARLLVVDSTDGDAATGVAGLLGSSGCPVLVVGRPDRCRQARVVVAAVTQDATDRTVVQRAVDEAALRGCELKLVLSYQRSSGEPGHDAANRAHQYLASLLASAPRTVGLEVTAVCTQGPAEHAVAQQAHGTELLVVHGGTPSAPSVWLDPVLRHPPTDLLVLRPSPDEGSELELPPAYRETLQRELVRQPDRADRCTTPEELDDAWHIGTTDPPVSADVARAWRDVLQQQMSVTSLREAAAAAGAARARGTGHGVRTGRPTPTGPGTAGGHQTAGRAGAWLAIAAGRPATGPTTRGERRE